MQKKKIFQFAFFFFQFLGCFLKAHFPISISFPQIKKVRSSLVKKFLKF